MGKISLVILGLGLLFATLQYTEKMKRFWKWTLIIGGSLLAVGGTILGFAVIADTYPNVDWPGTAGMAFGFAIIGAILWAISKATGHHPGVVALMITIFVGAMYTTIMKPFSAPAKHAALSNLSSMSDAALKALYAKQNPQNLTEVTDPELPRKLNGPANKNPFDQFDPKPTKPSTAWLPDHIVWPSTTNMPPLPQGATLDPPVLVSKTGDNAKQAIPRCSTLKQPIEQTCLYGNGIKFVPGQNAHSDDYFREPKT